jgi:hypothetical protein
MTRRAVIERAGERCEYCRLPQLVFPVPFHVEHIRATQHGGGDELDNLAWACPTCNLHKGPNLTGIDRQTDRIEPLFDPRRQRWPDHFTLAADGHLTGRTPTGRTTVITLAMNTHDQVSLRRLMLGHKLELG